MSKTDELQYAKDVLWVWKHVGESKEDLAELDDLTASRLVLHDWIGTPEGREALLKTILPKAQDALIKAKASKDPDSIVEKETKSIASLKEFIMDVVSESLTKSLVQQEKREAVRKQSHFSGTRGPM